MKLKSRTFFYRTPVLKLFSFLHPKDKVTLQLHLNGELVETLPVSSTVTAGPSTAEKTPDPSESGIVSYVLYEAVGKIGKYSIA